MSKFVLKTDWASKDIACKAKKGSSNETHPHDPIGMRIRPSARSYNWNLMIYQIACKMGVKILALSSQLLVVIDRIFRTTRPYHKGKDWKRDSMFKSGLQLEPICSIYDDMCHRKLSCMTGSWGFNFINPRSSTNAKTQAKLEQGVIERILSWSKDLWARNLLQLSSPRIISKAYRNYLIAWHAVTLL